MYTHYFIQIAARALLTAAFIVGIAVAVFFAAEPSLSHSQASDSQNFFVRQTITGDIQFETAPGNVTMDGSISATDGGSATGTTFAVVSTNNAAGYNLTIEFENNGTGHAMNGDVDTLDVIRNYGSTTVPSFALSASSSAYLAFTATATDASFIADNFKDNAGACGSGTQSEDTCWIGPTITPTSFLVYDRDSAAPNGATTSLKFVVRVPQNPVPALSAQTYTATATLTATVN